MKAVVMAGGQGTRLWPLSRRRLPKQFLPLISDQAMVAQCYKRLLGLFTPGDIYVSCVPEFLPLLRDVLPDLPTDQFIVEPARRDSGPAMAYAAQILRRAGYGREAMVFVPTDHAIADTEVFLRTVRLGLALALKTGAFVDIGVVPTAPLTTLGYTKVGEELDRQEEVSIHEFLGHVEKPDLEKAKQLMATGQYLWHANYYMATPDALLAAYQEHAPEIYRVVSEYDPLDAGWQESFARLKPVSIDYAVTEHLPPRSMRILRGEFGWSDVGQFAQLRDWLSDQTDETGNVVRGKHRVLDSTDCLIIGHPDKMIATIGLKNIAVVDTGDALLVCDLGRAAEVKQLLEYLEARGEQAIL